MASICFTMDSDPAFQLFLAWTSLATVAQFRELLERFLDDDDDMRDLNLTAKCAWHQKNEQL